MARVGRRAGRLRSAPRTSEVDRIVNLAESSGVPEVLSHRGKHHVDSARTMDDGWYSTRCTVGVVVLQPVDEPAEFARSRRPVTSNRGTPIEKQRQCAGIRLRRRFSATATGAEVKKPVVDPLGRAIAAVDDGPVALARRQLDPKRLERPHQPRRYDPA